MAPDKVFFSATKNIDIFLYLSEKKKQKKKHLL